MTPPDPAHSPAAFALALLRREGVGRVSAGRLVERFGSLAACRATPREQVLVRLKGLPHAEALVAALHEATMDAAVAEAATALERLAERRIEVLTPRHAHWPAGFAALDASDRPVVLYAFGDAAVLGRRSVALFAQPPVDGEAFELAQTLVRRLPERELVPVSGVQHGFDTVVAKLAVAAERPAVLVASAGLARVPPPMRPAAAAAVRAGGLLLSSFPPDHGPFPHDDTERARLMAALASASAFFSAPEGSAEARAREWALAHDRPTFGTPDPAGAPLPERLHPINGPAALDWVLAAASAA